MLRKQFSLTSSSASACQYTAFCCFGNAQTEPSSSIQELIIHRQLLRSEFRGGCFTCSLLLLLQSTQQADGVIYISHTQDLTHGGLMASDLSQSGWKQPWAVTTFNCTVPGSGTAFHRPATCTTLRRISKLMVQGPVPGAYGAVGHPPTTHYDVPLRWVGSSSPPTLTPDFLLQCLFTKLTSPGLDMPMLSCHHHQPWATRLNHCQPNCHSTLPSLVGFGTFLLISSFPRGLGVPL